MKILVDMDNTIADFDGAVCERWKLKFPNLTDAIPNTRSNFRIREDFPPPYQEDVNTLLRTPGIFLSFAPIDGAIEALQQLRQKGNQVVICTTPFMRSEEHLQEKRSWVRTHLGNDWPLSFRIDKTEEVGDLLVDDNPQVTGAFEPHWKHVVFDQPYNRHIVDKPRLLGWNNWPYLLTIK